MINSHNLIGGTYLIAVCILMISPSHAQKDELHAWQYEAGWASGSWRPDFEDAVPPSLADKEFYSELASDLKKLNAALKFCAGMAKPTDISPQEKLCDRLNTLERDITNWSDRTNLADGRNMKMVEFLRGYRISTGEIPQEAERITRVNGIAAPSNGATSQVPPPKVCDDEETMYKSAFALLRKREYANAREKFKQILPCYPKGSYALRTTYWIGETYYVEGEFETAANYFETRLATSDSDEESIKSRIKLALSLDALDKRHEACATLDKALTLQLDKIDEWDLRRARLEADRMNCKVD